MEKKRVYEEPIIEAVECYLEDVITTSGDRNETDIIPMSEYLDNYDL